MFGRLGRCGMAGFMGLAALLIGAAPASAEVPGFSDEGVQKAIEAAKDKLWQMYQEDQGHWPEPNRPPDPKVKSYRGGYTALACYGLLAAGESPQDPRMKRALQWLSKEDMNATYCLGLRAQVWTFLPPSQGRALLAKDAKQLMDSIARPKLPPVDFNRNPRYGSYGYVSAGEITPGGDHSNSQFGVLGVWAAARENMEVPSWYWQLVYRHWEHTQNADGGWGYNYVATKDRGKDPSKGTMTAAGLASLFVAFDNLYADKFTTCGRNSVIPPIQKGLDWFDRHYDPTKSFGGGPFHYYLYGVERVGLASGYKYFGKKDWYKLGAAELVRTQHGGGWGDLPNTVFSLLFLVRGRAPVLVNRLEYPGDWNNRPRALANLMRWTGRKIEGEVNWQIINLQSPVEEWHDAPVLLITGSQAPELTDAHLAKLRRYVQEGGMLVTIAECTGRAFDAAWRGAAGRQGLYEKLFGGYEIQRLPPDHKIYSAHFTVPGRTPLWGVSNGVRLLALHTVSDLPLHWQTNSYATQADAFELAFNMIYYTTDRASFRHRGTSPWPRNQPTVPLRLAKVARVRYEGNWDPEPLAWERFALLMGQKWQTRLTVEPVEADKLDPQAHRVAAMTGTGAVHLTAPQKEAIKAYAAGGGTLIIDAAGGDEAFGDAVARQLEDIFGADSLAMLPTMSAVYQLPGMEIAKARYREAAKERVGASDRPRLMGVKAGQRVAVFLSREDLTSGLVGYPCYTSIGYHPGTVQEPGTAVELMRNMVLYGNSASP